MPPPVVPLRLQIYVPLYVWKGLYLTAALYALYGEFAFCSRELSSTPTCKCKRWPTAPSSAQSAIACIRAD